MLHNKIKRFLKLAWTTYYLSNNIFFVFRKCDEADLKRGSFLPYSQRPQHSSVMTNINKFLLDCTLCPSAGSCINDNAEERCSSLNMQTVLNYVKLSLQTKSHWNPVIKLLLNSISRHLYPVLSYKFALKCTCDRYFDTAHISV